MPGRRKLLTRSPSELGRSLYQHILVIGVELLAQAVIEGPVLPKKVKGDGQGGVCRYGRQTPGKLEGGIVPKFEQIWDHEGGCGVAHDLHFVEWSGDKTSKKRNESVASG